MSETASSDGAARMTVRRMGFAYPAAMGGHWNKRRPEFSQIVNAASLAMPYLEPYLIKTMREARPQIRDAALLAALDDYVAQEAMHFRQHRKFNDELKARGYSSIEKIEAGLASDYRKLGETRSLAFNLAYAEGFESMALAIGRMLIADRRFLFGGSESGLLYATAHIMWRTRGGYQALLKEDGLWRDPRSRLALGLLLLRIFAQLTPKMLRILMPFYNPRQVKDPAWALSWARLFRADNDGAGRLDTTRLDAAEPIALSTGGTR